MRKSAAVAVSVLLLALAASSIYGLEAEKGRVITIKTEIAETVINTPVMSTLEGNQAHMAIRTAVPQKSDSKAISYDEISVTWTPTVTQDGSVNLSGSFKFVRHGYESQDVKLRATLKPGEPQKLPSVIVPAVIGGGKLQIALTVTATMPTVPTK